MLELETAYAVVEYGMRRYNRRESHCSLISNSCYSNIPENNNLLAALARSGKIYTEKDKEFETDKVPDRGRGPSF